MKRLSILFFAFALSLSVANAQTTSDVPGDCQNSNQVKAEITSQEAQGWEFLGYQVVEINYLVQPDPPYVAAILSLTYAVACEEGEACPQILKLSQYDIVILNDQGTCVYQK